jgi:alpha-galactosidase
MIARSAGVLLAVLVTANLAVAGQCVPLGQLDLSSMHQGRNRPTVIEKGVSIAGQKYSPAVRTVSRSVLWVQLDGQGERFRAMVGVDDAARNKPAAVRFVVLGDSGTPWQTGMMKRLVLGDGRKLWESGVMKGGEPAKAVDVPLAGLTRLCLLVDDAGGAQFTPADWAHAEFTVRGSAPTTISAPPEEISLLTPPPGAAPRINGPKVYGCGPGKPFLYRVPTTGERPLEFAAQGLPSGLVLDAHSGIIRGTAPARGQYPVTLEAQNRHGRCRRLLKIVAGDLLALTPPMGWNHWYAHYNNVTDRMMRAAADAMLSSGMADVGYQYVNIDDCWMNAAADARHNRDPKRVGPLRGAQGQILPNAYFPDMKALADYIHAAGLKAGLYTSPGPLTCAGFSGSYQHEAQDARQFAAWGFDFLKYDWCSYGTIARGDQSRAALEKPYRLMGGLLRQQDRDMVFNLCQYGMGDVWEWGAEVGGHSWRTAGDLGFELNRIFEVALKNAEHGRWSKPGAWNDPDYLQIGYVGSAHGMGAPKPCPLTPTEQYAFMSLWSLMASPLFYSGDMSRLDPLTLNVLCNPEVIAVDQDPLGKSAEVRRLGDDAFLMIKPLEDGSLAVGLCNRGEVPAMLTARWSDLGLSGKQVVRDLWRQKDLGTFAEQLSTSVGRRGVLLLRVSPAAR